MNDIPDEWPETFESDLYPCSKHPEHRYNWNADLGAYKCIFCEWIRRQPPQEWRYDIDTARSAVEEWDYGPVENQFGSEHLIATPCQLRFITKPVQNTERFHRELSSNGFTDLDTNPDRRFKGGVPAYDGHVCTTDSNHYRIRVYIDGGRTVRLFPHQDSTPPKVLARLINALQKSFKSGLEHHPLDRGSFHA